LLGLVQPDLPLIPTSKHRFVTQVLFRKPHVLPNFKSVLQQYQTLNLLILVRVALPVAHQMENAPMVNVFAIQAIWVETALPNAPELLPVPEPLSVLDMEPVRMVLAHAVLATQVRIALQVLVLEPLSVLDMEPVRMVLAHAVLATQVLIAPQVLVLEPLSVVVMGRVESMAACVTADLQDQIAL
jgi:hypothetical protein